MRFVPVEFLLIRVSRVRAPGGALERTVFEDVGALGMVLFFCTFGDEGDNEPISQGRGKDLAQNWAQVCGRLVTRRWHGK